MKRTLLIAASVAIAAPQVFAQAKNFEGFSLGLNAESTNSQTTLTGTGSDSNTMGSLAAQAQYTMALGPQFTLGLGATAAPASLNAGAVNGISYSTKNRASFDVTPGYAVSDTTLVYGKLSALTGTSSAVDATGAETTANLNGFGYGVGVRYLLDKNFFVQGDINSNRYNDVNGTSLSSTALAVGVGYKF